MKVEKIFFKATDGVKLFGILHTPEMGARDVIIATHGIASNCLGERDDQLARYLTGRGVAYFIYNNRGNGFVTKLNKETKEHEIVPVMGGAVYEDILDSYHDIKGAINKMMNIGFEKIHLQGHSLGATKTVYAYNEMKNQKDKKQLERINSIILLSLVDLPNTFKMFGDKSGVTKEQAVEYAEKLVSENRGTEIMNSNPNVYPISANTFLRYFKNNEKINFAQYTNRDFNYDVLNSFEVPVLMRWGNINELIQLPADELAKMMNEKIKVNKKDIKYIDGADHSYSTKVSILANEIYAFILNIRR